MTETQPNLIGLIPLEKFRPTETKFLSQLYEVFGRTWPFGRSVFRPNKERLHQKGRGI